jgi:DNA-binding CsgD family transcriptional regulator
MTQLEKREERDKDLLAVMSILVRSTEVRDADGLLALIKSEVTELLQHKAMICGYHVTTPGGNFVHDVLQYNYPAGYAQALSASDGRVNSPLMERWRATQEPVVFQEGRDDASYPADWVELFKQYKLCNIIGHGALDVRRVFGSYFVFACLPGEIGDREKDLLRAITPHLHLALMRAVAEDEAFGKHTESASLSQRQQEILRWIYHGKTNKEIADILCMTQKNVGYHVDQIFMKLGVRSRAQAASKAVLYGL